MPALILAALLLAGCAATHTALLCFPVTVGADARDALWCSPTDKVPSPPVVPSRKPDERASAQ